ncbi:MAG: hypothetical protein HGGPFJEG_02896 [Ignavibacteria bacterium]|nr:hypothetical protein [Ignavibacteria bacterium]
MNLKEQNICTPAARSRSTLNKTCNDRKEENKKGGERLPAETPDTFTDKGDSVITTDRSGHGNKQSMQDAV